MFFGFVCDLLTAQSLENSPTGISAAQVCMIVPPQSPSEMTDTRTGQHKRTGPNWDPGLFLGASGGGSTCRSAGIMFPGKSKRAGGRKNGCKSQVSPKAEGLKGMDEEDSVFFTSALHSCFYFAKCTGIEMLIRIKVSV